MRRPANLAFGIGGIDFLPLNAIGGAQAGYGGPDWRPDWLVIAVETACGDPVFVDRSQPGSPVFTAMHGMASWHSSPVAPSWHAFVRAVEAIRPCTKGREGPRGLRENALTSEERVRITAALQGALGVEPPVFWHLLLDAGAQWPGRGGGRTPREQGGDGRKVPHAPRVAASLTDALCFRRPAACCPGSRTRVAGLRGVASFEAEFMAS